MKDILSMGRDEILQLTPKDVDWVLSFNEFRHIAELLDAFWSYSYERAKAGKPGLHALLKSKKHSDGFFVSRILFQHHNILEIMADQLVRVYERLGLKKPDMVAGIPDGATSLGIEVARLMGVPVTELKKINGRIVFVSRPLIRGDLLLVEDFCTSGTGFMETVTNITEVAPELNVLPYELVVLNRGGLDYINIPDMNMQYYIISVIKELIRNFEPEECPLCLEYGSEAIKPKATDENWKLLKRSQE